VTGRAILIIGGTGVFGKRLVRHLATRSGISLHVSSRSAAKAEAFVKSVAGALAEMHPVALDRQVNLKARLSQIRPFIVVDCSGPFQGAQYETARRVLEARAHFIDLADARDYLDNFSEALSSTAKRHKISAITGASSTPTLSTCVATQLARGWQRVDTIDMCIAPGGRSDVGRSVTFADKRMTSTLGVADEGIISEQFWPFTFTLKLGTKSMGIQMPVSGWRIGKLRLPSLFAPSSETSEFIDNEGRFRFDVKLSVPLIGLLAHYRGWLKPNQVG